VRGSERVGIRHFGVPTYNKIAALEIAILRYPIYCRGSGDVEERAHMRIGDRHFRILDDKKLTTREVAKSRNATVPQS
jgi:hypothetical protein